jgi:hypothetical protein
MKKSFIITSMAAFAALCFSLTAQAQGPVVVSDKDDYHPGETALFQAAGFQPEELLDFSIAISDENGAWVPDIAWADVPADASGGAVVSYVVPETWADKTLQLTVMGLTSGLMATTTFTDHGTAPTLTYSNYSISASGNDVTISVDVAFDTTGTATHTIAAVDAIIANVPGPDLGNVALELTGPSGGNGQGTWSKTITGVCETTYTFDKTNTRVDSSSGGPHNFNNVDAGDLTATTGACESENNPPSIMCLDPATVDLGQAVGCLGDDGFCHNFPVTYTQNGPAMTVTVTAHITKADSSVVDVDIATVTDPDGDTVTVTLDNGTDPITICGPGTPDMPTPFSVDIHADDGQMEDNSTADGNCGGDATAQIVYDFHGFFPPLSGQINCKVKNGSGVPVKFQIFDCSGTPISTSTHTIEVQHLVGCVPAGPVDVEDAGNSNGDTENFRWDPTGMQWIFNLKTGAAYGYVVGNTYQITAHLDDGTEHNVTIAIK